MLAPLSGHRQRFRGPIRRLGQDATGRLTLLLTDVRHGDGWPIDSHCWVRLPDESHQVRRYIGGVVTFTAIPRHYRRGDGTEDYGLFALRDLRARGAKKGRAR